VIKPRHIIGNIPLFGRYIYPEFNKRSIFCAPGKYYSSGIQYKIDSFPNAKVAIFGLPKSGNTWIYGLMADYLDMKPIHLDHDPKKSGVGMSHSTLNYNLKIRRDLARGVYIMRDLRDILVSFYYYIKTDYFKEMNDPYSNFDSIDRFYYEYFLMKMIYRYNWEAHPNEFVKAGIPLIKYEDLYDHPEKEFTALLRKLNLHIDENKIEKVIEKNQFSNVSNSGKTLWKKVPSTHFRKGGYGQYKNEMSTELISDINERFGPYLKRWGYIVN
jgi:Sulfotransferase domain